MKLIVGGQFSGKYERLLELGFSPAEIANGDLDSFEEAFSKPAIYRVNFLLRRLLKEGKDVSLLLEAVKSHPDVTLACDEVGCGVVPIDPEERNYRGQVGRFCCQASALADSVERVWCGIVTELKASVEHS